MQQEGDHELANLTQKHYCNWTPPRIPYTWLGDGRK